MGNHMVSFGFHVIIGEVKTLVGLIHGSHSTKAIGQCKEPI